MTLFVRPTGGKLVGVGLIARQSRIVIAAATTAIKADNIVLPRAAVIREIITVSTFLGVVTDLLSFLQHPSAALPYSVDANTALNDSERQ